MPRFTFHRRAMLLVLIMVAALLASMADAAQVLLASGGAMQRHGQAMLEGAATSGDVEVADRLRRATGRL